MKRLVLVRHAKSSWDDPNLSDRMRPLNKRGARTAPLVARELARMGWAPDVVVCSNAMRAQMTWALMEPELGDVRTFPDPALYMGGLPEIRNAVRRLDDAHQTAWLIGHNPGWELAAHALCGFDAALKTADCVLMQSSARSWGAAIAPGAPWSHAGHLIARSVSED